MLPLYQRETTIRPLNVFTHFGLSAGSQTLYAKITRPGGTCPQIVPFTFVVTVLLLTFTTHPTNQTFCPGSPAVIYGRDCQRGKLPMATQYGQRLEQCPRLRVLTPT